MDDGLSGGYLAGSGLGGLSRDDVVDAPRIHLDRSRAALMAVPPNSTVETTSFSVPSSFPRGVRVAPTMTNSSFLVFLPRSG